MEIKAAFYVKFFLFNWENMNFKSNYNDGKLAHKKYPTQWWAYIMLKSYLTTLGKKIIYMSHSRFICSAQLCPEICTFPPKSLLKLSTQYTVEFSSITQWCRRLGFTIVHQIQHHLLLCCPSICSVYIIFSLKLWHTQLWRQMWTAHCAINRQNL